MAQQYLEEYSSSPERAVVDAIKAKTYGKIWDDKSRRRTEGFDVPSVMERSGPLALSRQAEQEILQNSDRGCLGLEHFPMSYLASQ